MAPAAYSTLFFHIPQLPHISPSKPSSHLRSFLSFDAESVASRPSSVHSTTTSDYDVDVSSSSSDTESTFSFFPTSFEEDSYTPTSVASSSSTLSLSSLTQPRFIPHPKPKPKATAMPALPSPPPPRLARSQDPVRRKHRDTVVPQPVTVLRTASLSTTASTQYRVARRTDALAQLEGRTRPRPISPPPYSPDAAVHRIKSAAAVLATKSFMPLSPQGSDSDSDDYEWWDDAEVQDVHIELVSVPSSPEIVEPCYETVREKKLRRRKTIDSWLVGPPPTVDEPPTPKSFIELDLDTRDSWWAKYALL